jgi:hypothetical protein
MIKKGKRLLLQLHPKFHSRGLDLVPHHLSYLPYLFCHFVLIRFKTRMLLSLAA